MLRSPLQSTSLLVLILGLMANPAWGSDDDDDDNDIQIDNLVVFGDSLSDPGNAFVLTGEVSVRPFDLIPSAAYLVGGFHITNGKTWIE